MRYGGLGEPEDPKSVQPQSSSTAGEKDSQLQFPEPSGAEQSWRRRKQANGGQGGRPATVTVRDQAILGWLARNRFATARQVQRGWELSKRMAYRRLARMQELGLLQHRKVFHGEPGVYLPTRAGLRVAGVDLPSSTVDLATYRHSVALVSLGLDLEPEADALVTEREIRHADGGVRERADLRYAVHLSGDGTSHHGTRLHIPDLVLVHDDGELEAVELELTPKRTRRLRSIIRAFVRARHLRRGVTYYTPKDNVARLVRGVARELEAEDVVTVRSWEPPEERGAG